MDPLGQPTSQKYPPLEARYSPTNLPSSDRAAQEKLAELLSNRLNLRLALISCKKKA